MPKRKNLQHRIDARRKVAEEKKQERAHRSPIQQLKILDDRLGVSAGAAQERKRLEKLIEAARPKKEKARPKKEKKTKGKQKHDDKKKHNRQKK